jgi:hypothetical protein
VERPELRVGDAERAKVAEQLREHWALGWLETDELEQRVDAAYRARTRGDLAALVADLPEFDNRSSLKARRFLLPGSPRFTKSVACAGLSAWLTTQRGERWFRGSSCVATT